MSGVRVRVAVVLVATFLLGAAAGAAALHAVAEDRFRRELHRPWPQARERFMLDAMTRRLDLSDDQRARIEGIFRKHRDERRRIMEKCGPEHEALKRLVDDEIREVLTPAQRALHEKLHRRRGPPDGPPPDGPP